MPKHIENIGIPNLSVVNKFLDSDRFSDEKPGDDPSEIFDIREFKDGDRLNSIHWNLTVKTGKIMVKDFSFPLNNSDRIVFASQKKVFDNTDMMFEGLLSLIYLMLEQKRTVTICYPNNKIWDEVTIEGYEDVVSALKTILECDVTTSEIDEVNISDTLSSTNGNCYLITDNVSEKNNFKDMFGILTINSIIESRRIIKLKDWMIYE